MVGLHQKIDSFNSKNERVGEPPSKRGVYLVVIIVGIYKKGIMNCNNCWYSLKRMRM